jgi:hypothetical protein
LEISKDDFVEGPVLNKDLNYLQFVDIGYTLKTSNKRTGVENVEIKEGVALLESDGIQLNFIELEIKIVQQLNITPMSRKKQTKKTSDKKTLEPKPIDSMSYAGTGFTPKLLFSYMSQKLEST